MGDVLICSVVFEFLKKKFPHAELHYLIDEKYHQVVEHHQYIDKFLFFGKGFSDTLKAVRSEKYDIIIDTYSKIETALISFLSGADKRISYYKSYTRFFYTNPVHRRKKAVSDLTTTTIEHRMQLLEPLGITFEIAKPEILLTDSERKCAEAIIEKFSPNSGKKVMISTFGSSPEKTYPLAFMREVIEEISMEDVGIFCNYLPNQKTQFDEFFATLSVNAQSKVSKDFDTKNLREFIAVLSFCDALVGNEGGSTNISKALGVPTFTIFSPQVAKKSWNWFDDGIKNDSVHLHDYIAESNSYDDFKPGFFQDKLHNFIAQNLR